ncbi:hypothetical protein tb265_41650 [Gemmatimonadetes bacterium T265]|nr:hypothetical protein tb265_41650 [Gemmatimonadetes bacterium T265]
MKTTLILPDPLMVALKRRAAERKTSLSALATELIQRGLDEPPRTHAAYKPNFPVFENTGLPLVDISDREALYDVLNAERDARLYGLHPASSSSRSDDSVGR